MSQPERRAQYFHQKGWIGSHFLVKNNLNSILKTRLRKAAETVRPELPNEQTPIHYKSSQFSHQEKPFTAPNKLRQPQTREFSPLSRQDKEQFVTSSEQPRESKYSSFKATLSHRKPLLFLRPYSRNRVGSHTIDQTKSEVYREINNPGFSAFDSTFHNGSPIQYLTEYTESSPLCPRSPVIARPVHRNKASLNVLREKLKRRGGTEAQKGRIASIKVQ